MTKQIENELKQTENELKQVQAQYNFRGEAEVKRLLTKKANNKGLNLYPYINMKLKELAYEPENKLETRGDN